MAFDLGTQEGDAVEAQLAAKTGIGSHEDLTIILLVYIAILLEDIKTNTTPA